MENTTIQGNDFKLVCIDGYSWDLHVLTSSKTQPFKPISYGMPLDYQLRKLNNWRMDKKEEPYSFDEYIKAYKDGIKEIREFLLSNGIKISKHGTK